MAHADISLVVPTYNRADLIAETLDSALAQSVPFAAIIVVDNGSTDNTSTVLARYGGRLTRIVTTNVGVQAARNLGAAAVATSHIAFCDSDDLLSTDYVQTVSDVLRQAPSLQAVYSNFVNFDAAGDGVPKLSQAPAGWLDGATPVAPGCITVPDLYVRSLRFQPLFPTGLAISKNFYDALGGFDPQFRGVGAEDWEFSLRVMAAGRVGLLQPVCARIRRHPGNDSRRAAYMAEGEARILAHALAHHARASGHRALFLQGIALRQRMAFDAYFAEGDWVGARRLSRQMGHSDRSLKAWAKRMVLMTPGPLRDALWRRSQRAGG